MSTFVDVEENVIATQQPDDSLYTAFGAMAIGNGENVFRADQSGIWLGAKKWADAPFRVDMLGNLTATSLAIGYVPTGGAAADINANVTSINAGKINISGSTTFSSGYDPSGKVAMVGGNYASSNIANAAKVQIFPNVNTGIVAYTTGGTNVVFQVMVEGTDVGDVTIGNYGGGYGALWDQSAGVFYVRGDITAGNISANRVNSGTLSIDRIPTLTVGWLDVDTLSSITANMGNLTAGTISAGTIILSGVNLSGSLGIGGGGVQPSNLIIGYSNSGAGSNAYLRFGSSSGSKMWADTSNRIGINSLGNPMYIYVNSSEAMRIYSDGQTHFPKGVASDGSLNVTDGNLRVNAGSLWVNTYNSPSERLWIEGSGAFIGNLKCNHFNPRSNKTYNQGSDSTAWDYIYADDFINKSLGWYDDGVELQDGTFVSDMESLRLIRPHKTYLNKNGSIGLDWSTLPKAVFREAHDQETGIAYKKNKDGVAISPETGELVGDSESLTGMVSLLMGALKEVDKRLLNIEKGTN